MRISDWSSDVCSSDLAPRRPFFLRGVHGRFRTSIVTQSHFATMHAESGISGRHKMKAWKAAVGASGVLLTCASAPAFALGFDLFDGDVIGHFNTTDRKSTRLNSSH